MSRRWILVFFFVATLAGPAAAQSSDASVSVRKVTRRILPIYPDLARRSSIGGSVKLVVTVAPNGSVQLIEPVGGNPLLVKAAQEAVTNWKFVAGPEKTKELIELRFNAH